MPEAVSVTPSTHTKVRCVNGPDLTGTSMGAMGRLPPGDSLEIPSNLSLQSTQTLHAWACCL